MLWFNIISTSFNTNRGPQTLECGPLGIDLDNWRNWRLPKLLWPYSSIPTTNACPFYDPIPTEAAIKHYWLGAPLVACCDPIWDWHLTFALNRLESGWVQTLSSASRESLKTRSRLDDGLSCGPHAQFFAVFTKIKACHSSAYLVLVW